MPKQVTTLADIFDQAEPHVAALGPQFDPYEPARMGLTAYLADDDLPAEAYYRIRLAAIVAVRVPDALADAFGRVQALHAKHADYSRLPTKTQAQSAFARRGFFAPSHNHRTTSSRARWVMRLMANWGRRFFRKHGHEFIREYAESVLDWSEQWHLGDLDHLEVALIVFGVAEGKLASSNSERWPHVWLAWVMMCAAAAPYGVEMILREIYFGLRRQGDPRSRQTSGIL